MPLMCTYYKSDSSILLCPNKRLPLHIFKDSQMKCDTWSAEILIRWYKVKGREVFIDSILALSAYYIIIISDKQDSFRDNLPDAY